MDWQIFSEVFIIIFIAGVANMVPVFIKQINFLNFPLDLNFKIFNQPVLGKGKTLRGVFFGSISGLLTSAFIFYFFDFLRANTYILNTFFENIFWSMSLGFLIASSAILGDVFKSFIKRRLGKLSGQTWLFFDQLDWIFGVLVCLLFLGFLKIYHFYLLPIGLIGHFLFKLFGNFLNIDDKKI